MPWDDSLATEVEAGVFGGGLVSIGTNVPPELVAFYNAAGYTVNLAWIGQYVDSNNYHYSITGNNGFNQPVNAHGWVRSGLVYEGGQSRYEAYLGVPQVTHVEGVNSYTTHLFRDATFRFLDPVDGTFPGPVADIFIAGSSMSRGPIGTRQMSGNPITTIAGGGAEVQLANLGLFPTTLHRAYRIDTKFTVQGSAAAGNLTVRWHRNTLAGATVQIKVFPILTTARFEVDVSGIGIVGAGPAPTDLVLGMTAAAGSNVSVFASGSQQGQFEVWDIGSDGQFAGYQTL